MSDLVQRLKDACAGHPNAEIPWPHRLLHEAAAEIERLRERLAVWPVDPRAGAFLKDQPILSEDCDGIACRDETIRVLDEQRVKMRAEIEHERSRANRLEESLNRWRQRAGELGREVTALSLGSVPTKESAQPTTCEHGNLVGRNYRCTICRPLSDDDKRAIGAEPEKGTDAFGVSETADAAGDRLAKRALGNRETRPLTRKPPEQDTAGED